MAFTQSDLDRLQAAISAGIQEVTFADGRKTRYQSMDHMLSAVKVMRSDIAEAATAGRPRRTRTIVRVGRC